MRCVGCGAPDRSFAVRGVRLTTTARVMFCLCASCTSGIDEIAPAAARAPEVACVPQWRRAR